MKFELPVLEGQFIKRYKRFFVDLELDGEVVTAHIANTGSMKSCMAEGAPCRVTVSDDPKRKLKHSVMMIKPQSAWVGVNTAIPNKIVWEAFENKTVPHWKSYACAKREIKINDQSRLDMVLWKDDSKFNPKKKIDPSVFSNGEDKFHFVEVKNVTLCENKKALFPDAVTTRGQKHLEELMKLIDMGHTAELVFTVQRNDVESFSPAKDIDPRYAELLKQAHEHGVIISIYVCQLGRDSIVLDAENTLELIF